MDSTALVLGQSSDAGGAAAAFFFIIYLAIIVLIIAAMWKVFDKANQPGWAALIPVYNVVILLKVAGKPIWWIILMFIPIVQLIPGIMVPAAIAKNFGKSVLFAVGLIFLPFIFYPILGFGRRRI